MATNTSNGKDNKDMTLKCETTLTEQGSSSFDSSVTSLNEKQQQQLPPSLIQKFFGMILRFYHAYQFPCNILLAVVVASLYPPMGAIYFQPEITASWMAVMLVFLLSGLGLKTEELSKAFTRSYFNFFVQIFNFFGVSLFVYIFCRVLIATQMLDEPLAEGMIICSCLPVAINSAIILTIAAGGDEAAAVFNATFGNFAGIFLSPVLILMYIGRSGNTKLSDVFLKLTLQAVVPLIIGQIVQHVSTTVRDCFTKHKKEFKKMQEYCLVYIVYTVFCRTFLNDAAHGTSLNHVLRMIAFQFLLMVIFMISGWEVLSVLFHDEPELRVMGFFGCHQKTVALGIPLITSLYVDDPREGLYTLPLLVWHPMQLVVGSSLIPALQAFVKSERERIDYGLNEESCTAADTDVEASSQVPLLQDSGAQASSSIKTYGLTV